MVKIAPKNLENEEIVEKEEEGKKPAASDTKVSDARAALSDLMMKNFSSFSHSTSTLRQVRNKAELFSRYIQYLREQGKGDMLMQLCEQL